MIGVIDYAMGNLRSVQKGFERCGAEVRLVSSPDDLEGVDRLVLPGVGAFGDGMEHLRQRGWPEAIGSFIASGKPFLGICLGMQLLFDGSEEDAPTAGGLVEGLGLLPGSVVRFSNDAPDGQRLKVPHMGWNTITWQRDDPLLRGLSQGDAVYFVHCYYVKPQEGGSRVLMSATADYGRPFCATVWEGNVWATQFHPEKSQTVGLKILANFASL
jgi:glutamine amidotransferase